MPFYPPFFARRFPPSNPTRSARRRAAHRAAMALLVAGLALPGATSAQVCEAMITLSREQASALLADMISPEVTALDQLYAFEELQCSDQPGVRELALRTAGLSQNPVIRSQVLSRALFEKEVLVIHLQAPEEPGEEHLGRLEQYPTESLPILFRDPAQGCMSFHDTRTCSTTSLGTVFGNGVDISITHGNVNTFGSFTYDHGDRLNGTITFRGLAFPAWIGLF